jgi:hypothetical protein
VSTKSGNCFHNEHSLCEGVVIEIINDSKVTKICGCQCHNSMYQLIRKTLAVINQSNMDNFALNENDYKL